MEKIGKKSPLFPLQPPAYPQVESGSGIYCGKTFLGLSMLEEMKNH